MAANYTQAWLEDPTSIRGILVEITVKDLQGIYGTAGSENVIYLSNIGYVSGDSQTSYLPFLTGSLQTTESISLDGSLTMSFGDIAIANTKPNENLSIRKVEISCFSRMLPSTFISPPMTNGVIRRFRTRI